MSIDYEIISSNERLAELCEKLQTQTVLALDTEFIRVNTFYPKPGLIQLSDGVSAFLLDPLSIDQWQPLLNLLTAPDIVKVLHAGSEDLILFLDFFGCLPQPFFDTQKAAAFLGHGPSISYLNLVKTLIGVELDKGETRSDWLQRPLTSQQLHYAALDVKYLPSLYQQLVAELVSKSRLTMVEEECELMRQLALATEQQDNWEDLYRQMGAAWRLDARQLGALKSLCLWREQQARLRNKPRTWIARDPDLITLAQRMPSSVEALKKIPDLTRSLYNRDAEAVIDLILQSTAVDPDIPASLEGAPLDNLQRGLLKSMQRAVRDVASQTEIAEEILARKKVLIQILRLNQQDAGSQGAKEQLVWPEDFQPWRQSLLQAPLQRALGKAVGPVGSGDDQEGRRHD
ncbi:ribonuclease D [Pseudohongiella sp. O18]|uniref:ribonuclease D n=1 Tax=Pseudohongiella sp. O18 TaxID=2904248 RepID=UPI001F009F69|nr:ribonuclease D [Pseudohongiella sp. O18]